MGLKTKNFTSTSKGIVLPEAYAILSDITVNKSGRVRAVFHINTSRQNALDYEPIDRVAIFFDWDRVQDVAKAAYEHAKTEMRDVEKFIDNEYVIVKEHGTLYGWTNDIE